MPLNNREWAALVWLSVGVIWMLSRRNVRSSLRDVARTAWNAKIVIPIAVMGAYVGGLVFIGRRLGLWHPGLTKSTLIWALVTGLVLLMNSTRVAKEERFFTHAALQTLELSVFIEFLTNLFVLNLAAELVLQPIVIFLVMLSAVAAGEKRHLAVRRMADGLLTAVGLSLATFAIIQLIRQWDQLDKTSYLLEFALPVWLTIGVLPYIYFVSLYATYELAFMRIGLMVKDQAGRRRAKLALVTTVLGRTKDVNAFTGYWATEAASATSFASARKVIKHLQETRRLEIAKDREQNARLARYAGVQGVDEDGRPLDRREFDETKRALRWLATCQMGWYRRRGDRYRRDLLDLLGHDFTSHGLPAEHGITMDVAKGGRAWWAWRRTVGGWCFAIGAAGPPPDQWEFDGPEPPDGFPGKDTDWGDSALSLTSNRNW